MNLAKLAMDGSSEGPIKWVYNQMYETVSAANNIIYHALRIPETERSAVQKRSLGEAYFMRAFTHYMIAYRYGRPDNGVPLSNMRISPTMPSKSTAFRPSKPPSWTTTN